MITTNEMFLIISVTTFDQYTLIIHSSMDDDIELLELNSPSSSKSHIKSKLKKHDNKIGSSSTSSPTRGEFKTEFSPTTKPRLPPIPAKRSNRRISKSTTEITSGSQETIDGYTRERRSDEFTESVFSSKSDTKSYREKFRERFESVKKEAGKSVSKAHKSYAFKSKAEKIKNLKRSINLMQKENREIEAELRDYRRNKAKNGDVHEEDVSKIDAKSFFCDEQEFIADQDAADAEEENLNDMGKSTEVLIGVHEDKSEDDRLTRYLPAENVTFNMEVSENELFWSPSSKAVNVAEKLSGNEPRFLEEEGFYIESPTNIPSSHLNVLEQRLLSAKDDKKWFNCEGKLEMLQNPYSKTSYRPYLYLQHNPQFETVYMPALTDEIANTAITSIHPSIMNVYIAALNFKHHPLFSSEHVFEQKLIKYYDIYRAKLNTDKLERISKRLDALRAVKRTQRGKEETDSTKISKCNTEIKKLRELYYEEGKQSRILLKSILNTWRTIKKIRQSNGYSNTSVKLNIRKEKCSYEQEKLVWKAKIEETCEEILSELELQHQAKMKTYKTELEEWKLQIQAEEENEENIKKPKKPTKNADPEVIVHEVTEKFRECFKPPGEPILHFTLSYDNTVTDKTENNKEKLRRNAVATTKIYLKLLCNKIEICKSKPIPLNDKFVCYFDETFSIQITSIPENISVEIHEQPSTLMKRKLGEVTIKVPPKTVYTKYNKITEENFEKSELIHYKHEGVGSGTELKDILPKTSTAPDGNDENDKEILNTAGVLTFRIGWDIDGNTHDLEDNERLNIERSILNEDGTIDVNKLNDWIKENNPDPQDPKNSILYEYIKDYDVDIRTPTNSTKKYFRLNPEMNPLEFCDSKEIEDNIRFKILYLRNKNEPEFVGMTVPNRLKEIPHSALDDYNQRLERETKENIFEDDEYNNVDDIDIKRNCGRKCLKQIYIKVFQQCRSADNNLVYEDVVNEKLMPYIESLIRSIISNIRSWFQLHPTIMILSLPTSRKPSLKTSEMNGTVKIIVNVNSGLNIPIKSAREISAISQKTTNLVAKHFVEISYQNVDLQTSSVDGTSPVWNEELVFSLESASTDYLSPNSLSGSIVIKLFDEIDEKARPGEIIKIKNWLGSIEIPISAVSYNNKMEGLFKLQKPSHLLGYQQQIHATSSARINSQQGGIQDTYLSLKINLQPNFPKLTHNMNELETTELPYLKQYILNWNEQFNTEYPNRKFFALAIDINGRTACITRYIRPLEPPQLNSDRFMVSAEQCVQYVSLIPFTDTNKFYQNVWLTTEQLLKFMVGSVVDHAIALTCYLTSLDLEVWLLLGYGLSHGSTAYVLIREYNREPQVPLHFIYDVMTGIKHDTMDTLCPLQKIYCVVNEHNVWANLQHIDQIQSTRFDFNRRSDWLPLFTNQTVAPTNSIQQKLTYTITPDIQQLEFQINKKIRKRISKLRKHQRTIWNHYVSHALKKEIFRFELNRLHERRNSEMFLDLKDFESMHHIHGYVLNLPYITISTIITSILSTGIHLHESSDIEFGLAVQGFAYPNHVLSMWICLVSIIKK